MFFPIRYADDFVVLVSGTEEDAIAEKEALANYLRQTTGLELSPEKTKITPVTDGIRVSRIPRRDAMGYAIRIFSPCRNP